MKSEEIKQEVLDWINSKNRDFSTGLEILKKTGYKPHVTGRLEKKGDSDHSKRALKMELSNYLRFLKNPKNIIHEDEEEEVPAGEDVFVSNIEKELKAEYPPIVKKTLEEFHSLYTSRSLFHKQLKEVGEGNDDKSMAERKRIVAIIDATSHRMDDLWAAFNEYKKNEIEPSEELFSEPFDPEKVEEVKKEEGAEEPAQKLELPNDLPALEKLKNNLRIKIGKNENKLLYQSEKKEETPNPMPEGPKRAELEKKIEQWKKEKEAVEYKIVELK